MAHKIFLRESIRLQLFGWPIYCLLMLLINSKLKPNTDWQSLFIAWVILFVVFNACLAILYIVFSKKMIWKSLVLIVCLYILLSEGLHYMGKNWNELKEELFSTKREQYYWTIFANYIGVWIMAGGLVFHIKSRLNEQLRKEEMELRHAKELEAKEKEFAFRTVQINSHFLFNVLNTMKSRVQIQTPDVAHNMDQLADLMRYMLSTSEEGKKKVLLCKELEALQLYIALESTRFEKTYVNFKIKGEPRAQKIVPIALITIVENAFKYGVYTQVDKPIEIELLIEEEQVLFHCRNTINRSKEERPSLGLGQKNMRSRLNFAFSEKYSFEAKELPGDIYDVKLVVLQD